MLRKEGRKEGKKEGRKGIKEKRKVIKKGRIPGYQGRKDTKEGYQGRKTVGRTLRKVG